LRRLEEVLAVGNWLYRAVRLVERNWRNEVIAGKVLYDPAEEESIATFFHQWYAPRDRFTKELSHFASQRIKVVGGDEFERNCVEAQAILAGRNPFLDDPSHAARWAVLTAFRHPDARPIEFDDEGRVFEMTGEELTIPGLKPERVLQARDEMRIGQRRTLREIVASRKSNGI
jgi:hypothetical protein